MCLAIPGRIVDISPDQPNTAVVEVVGVRRNVDLGFLQHNPPVAGDWVLIHVGFAISKISEDDALETLRMLAEPEACHARSQRVEPRRAVMKLRDEFREPEVITQAEDGGISLRLPLNIAEFTPWKR